MPTHVEFDIASSAPPEKVIAALTDFTDRRPEIWPGISRSWYEVYSVEATSADVREGSGSPKGSIWAKEHYDWSMPGLVTWTVRESGFCAPGSFVSAKVDRAGDGGSKIHITWEREPTTTAGRVAAFLIKVTRGGPVASSFKKGLRRLEQEEPGRS